VVPNARTGIEQALASFSRRRWVALSIFALVLSVALSFAKSLPNLYESTATLLVERPASQGGADDVESRLQSIRQEILSRTRLAELIGRLDLYPAMRTGAWSQEAVVERMRRDVRIGASGSELAAGRGTIAFALAYRGRDPVKVTLVANALASSYIEEESVLRERQTSGAAGVLRTQLDEVKKRLAPQEARIAEFKRLHAGELPQQADSSFLAVERLNGQLQRVSDTRAAAVERRATLLREAGEPGALGDASDPDRVRLARLTQELAALRTRFSDRYPDVASKKAEVDSLSAVVASKPQVDRALPQLEQANREIRSLQAQEARLQAEIGLYQRRVEGAPFREQEYQVLARDYQTTRDFYDTLLKRYEEAQLAEAREDGPQGQRLRLLDPAITPVSALAPDRIRLAMFGLIAALALAVVGVAGAEKLDSSFHSAEDLGRHTRVPVLVRIPRMSTDSAADRTRARRRAALLALGLTAGLVIAVSASRLVAQDNETVVAILAPRGRP
jgi:polysaccharide chain length determinant protein (PEP-CTERM system associated)